MIVITYVYLLGCLLLCCHQETQAFNSRFTSRHFSTSADGTLRPRKLYPSPRKMRLPSLQRTALPTRSQVTELLTTGEQSRPEWLPAWIPTWLCNLRQSIQLGALLLGYLFHIVVICQHSIPFPIQLIPNDRGHFQSVGLDS